MDKKALIIGYGSIGRRHAAILKKLIGKKNIFIFTKRVCKDFNIVKNLKEIKSINPDYIIICTETAHHLKHLLFCEKNLKNKLILVEKPLFSKFKNIKILNNKIFVAYNLRYLPIIQNLKNIIKKKNIYSVNIFCSSHLPYWRKNINYKRSYSANRKLGGGVLLDMSHEIDYIQWIFGNINKIIYKKIFKISNLKINVEDSAIIISKIKKINLIINLNFFSKTNKREIIIDGNNINLRADLIKNKLEIYQKKNNKPAIINYKVTKNYNYENMHKDLLKKGHSKVCCTFNEGKIINKLIDKIKNK